MKSKSQNVIIAVLVIINLAFVFVNGNNTDEIEDFEDERLEYLVEIDNLEQEIRNLEDELFDYEEELWNLQDEMEEQVIEYYGDYERMLFTDADVCCTIKGDEYYHRFFYCFGTSTEIEGVYIKDKNIPQGYSPCPECY